MLLKAVRKGGNNSRCRSARTRVTRLRTKIRRCVHTAAAQAYKARRLYSSIVQLRWQRTSCRSFRDLIFQRSLRAGEAPRTSRNHAAVGSEDRARQNRPRPSWPQDRQVGATKACGKTGASSRQQRGGSAANGARLAGAWSKAERGNLSRLLRSGFQDAEGRSALRMGSGAQAAHFRPKKIEVAVESPKVTLSDQNNAGQLPACIVRTI